MTDGAGAGPRAQGRVGTVINGKWRVDARIGAGGMATVYAATHRNGSRAALKMLHTPLSKDAGTKARFLREGYVANTVAHPGVVAVLDDGVTEDGAAFLVLELLEGETAEARRERLGGKLSLGDALAIADQALDALAAAHAKGIVHRDVKPDNVFLTFEGRVKLLDFGLARMRDETTEATRTGVTIGTPEFMAPEQAVGKRGAVDARSDVWGLGATLFTLITGEYVHNANTLHEQLLANATHRARPIRTLARHVPHAIAAVIDCALELEKDHRWPSAREMQDAFRRAHASVAIHADEEGTTSPASRGEPGVVSSAAESSDPTMAMSRGTPPSSDETLRREAPVSRAMPPSSGETVRRDVVPVTHDVPHENDEVEETLPVSVDELRAAQRRADDAKAAKAQVPPPPSTDVDLPPVTPPVSTPPVTARLATTSAPEGVPAVNARGATAAMPPITPGGGVHAVRSGPAQFATFGETVPMKIASLSSGRAPVAPMHQPQTMSMAGPMTPRSAVGPAPSHAAHPNAHAYAPTPHPGPVVAREATATLSAKRAFWPVWLLAFVLTAVAALWAVVRAGLVHLP